MIGSYGHSHDPRRNQHSNSDIMRVGIASSKRDHDGNSTREGQHPANNQAGQGSP